jgi:DNA-binding response OmpR family regulator
MAMTALSMPGDRERCLAAGMDDHLSKPILPEDFEAIIERFLPSAQSHAPQPDASGASKAHDGAQKEEGALDQATIRQLRACCHQLELRHNDDSDVGEGDITELRATTAEASDALRHALTH